MKGTVYNAPSFATLYAQEWLIQRGSQSPLLADVDGGVGEASHKCLDFLRELCCIHAGGLERGIILQRPVDAKHPRWERTVSGGCYGGLFVFGDGLQQFHRRESGCGALFEALQHVFCAVP